MPMSALITRVEHNVRCLPLVPGDAKRDHFNIPPNTTIAAGTVVGKHAASANDVETIADSVGTITAGTFTYSSTNPLSGATYTTAAIAYDANNAALKAAIELAAGAVGPAPTVTAAGSGLPGNDTTLTFSGNWAGIPVPLGVINSAGLTGGVLTAAKTTVGRSAGTVAAYVDSGATDPAIGVMEYTVTSRADGRLHVGSATDASSGESLPSAPVWTKGRFACADLTGLDAAGAANLGRLVYGSHTTGVLAILGG